MDSISTSLDKPFPGMVATSVFRGDVMDSLQYFAPTSLEEATQLLGEHRGSQVLAGGTDLIVQMQIGTASPASIVDIKKIPEVNTLALSASGLKLGAAVAGASITEKPEIAAVYPGLVEAIDLIGSTQIQGRCSVGGNLCNASPAADTVPSLIVTNAVCEIQGSSGTREVAAEEFNLSPGKNCLSDGEFLTSIRVPKPVSGTADAYLRFIPRTEMDIAVVGAAVSVTMGNDGICTAARVAIGAVAPTALLVPAAADALIGTDLNEQALHKAGDAASEAASPISDKRGTAEYRTKVVGVLTRRAAAIAKKRALQN
ncbi:MAG: xanthine dehydrogenase family protein subunit M [Pseudomonadales bacterium]|nr:xanthine dehydrogenase family protein subunit M [Pseudomonadales bacterium]